MWLASVPGISLNLRLPSSERFPFMSRFCRRMRALSAWQAFGHSERILPFAYVYPRGPDAAAVVCHWVRERGFHGLRFCAPIGFSPDVSEVLASPGAVNDLRLTILLHTDGVAAYPRLASKYCRPVALEGSCMAAPDCSVICSHFSNPGPHEAFCIGWGCPNLSFDWTTSKLLHKDPVIRGCRHELLGPRQFLSGTEGPSAARLQDSASYRKDLAGMGLTTQGLEVILGESAASIPGICGP